MTDLSDAEIVLGKLGSRLAPILGVLACGVAGDGAGRSPGRDRSAGAVQPVRRLGGGRRARVLAGAGDLACGPRRRMR